MKSTHWIGAVVLVLVAYYVGVKYPTLLHSIPGASSVGL